MLRQNHAIELDRFRNGFRCRKMAMWGDKKDSDSDPMRNCPELPTILSPPPHRVWSLMETPKSRCACLRLHHFFLF